MKNIVVFLLLAFVSGVFLFISKKIHAPTQSSNRNGTERNIHLAVLPHHNLLLDYYPSFYSQLVDDPSEIRHVIILSPNHFHGDFQSIVTVDKNVWSEHGLDIPIDGAIVQPFLQQRLVLAENQFFINEHGVFLHLPFIRQYFPESKISAFLFTRNVPMQTLDDFEKKVLEITTDESTLVLVSSDFSHYLSFDEAEVNDQKSLSLLNQRKFDEIYQLSDDYVDCSACLYLVSKLSTDLHYDSFKNIFHSNSAIVQGNLNISETTSYFVLRME